MVFGPPQLHHVVSVELYEHISKPLTPLQDGVLLHLERSSHLLRRSEIVVQDGYEFFANKRLVTIFSAPHYCGQFDNAAAMMNVDEGLVCSFQIMRPTIKANKVVARSS
ncbi:hypothetical protein COOONC_27595 [Cooperia oncophora]